MSKVEHWKNVCRCVPFIEPGAGVRETQEAIEEMLAEIALLTAEVATLRQRCGRLRELALASVRPQGLVTSPESVRWFTARHKCFRHNDLTQG